MGLSNMFSEQANKLQQNLHWGGAYSLWDICRNKAIGVPVLQVFLEQASDTELKELIKKGIEIVAIPNVEKIEDFLKKEELTYPSLPERNKMDDQHIARSIMEILRLSLTLDMKAFTDATREDLRNFIWDITKDDKKAFDKIVELCTKKSWLLNPPTL